MSALACRLAAFAASWLNYGVWSAFEKASDRRAALSGEQAGLHRALRISSILDVRDAYNPAEISRLSNTDLQFEEKNGGHRDFKGV